MRKPWVMAEKLANAGLIPKRESATLQGFIDGYIDTGASGAPQKLCCCDGVMSIGIQVECSLRVQKRSDTPVENHGLCRCFRNSDRFWTNALNELNRGRSLFSLNTVVLVWVCEDKSSRSSALLV